MGRLTVGLDATPTLPRDANFNPPRDRKATGDQGSIFRSKGAPWKDYTISGYKCGTVLYKCPDNDCEATISTCSVKQSGSYAGIIAKGLPERATGVRIGTAWKPKDCPVVKVP